MDLQNSGADNLLKKSIQMLDQVSDSLAAVKLNYHILLPLDFDSVRHIVDHAHDCGLQAIADIKLNDIASTNLVAASHLWRSGFDALIANPFVGYEGGLGPVLNEAHREEKGVLLLVYMSHPGAKEGYGLALAGSKKMKIYEIFLEKALRWGADGIIVGATNPRLVKKVVHEVRHRLLVFSPGIGAQGGSASQATKAGADFLIVGRTITESPKPHALVEDIRQATWNS